MKNKLKSISIPLILCGFWGVLISLFAAFMSGESELFSILFYPVLFAGITLIISLAIELGISFTRALIVGLLSGFIYQVLSPIFPFLASVLAGASLGGGLIADLGKWGDLFNRILSTIKGVFLFPVFIYLGGLVGGLISMFASDFLVWLFWGAWTGLAVCSISMPMFKRGHDEQDFHMLSELDEFKSEANEILRDLGRTESRIN